MNKLFTTLIFAILLTSTLVLPAKADDVIVHDVSTGRLVIPGNSDYNYVITGSTNTNYVVVETGYQGIITFRNLNITLSVDELIKELWEQEYPTNLENTRQSNEYKEKQADLASFNQELIDLPERADFLQKLLEQEVFEEQLDNRMQQPDYKTLEQEREVLREELTALRASAPYLQKQEELRQINQRLQALPQRADYRQLEQEIQELQSAINSHVLNTQITSKRQEIAAVQNREDYPGKQQDLARLNNELNSLISQLQNLPQVAQITAKEREKAQLEQAIRDEMNEKQREITEMEQPLNDAIQKKSDDMWAIVEPIWMEIWRLQNERAQMQQEIQDRIDNKQAELQQMEQDVLDAANAKERELHQVMNNSPISVRGQNERSNLNPITNVDIILEGENVLCYTGTRGYAAFHVEQGAQINIGAIDPANHNSGKLSSTVTSDHGGAGIGAMNHEPYGYGVYIEATATAQVLGGCVPQATAGGNIVIASGTVITQGGHGAGIGGGWGTYYDGMIVIYGGIVDAVAIRHAAGIGSGCPTGTGILPCFTPNSAIIVLPPAQITAAGAANTAFQRVPDLALAGSNNIVYIGDPEKPLITVHTEDFRANANIYVDLSESPNIANVIYATVAPERLDVNKVRFGQAGNDGNFYFHGILDDNITFFTDATSSSPTTFRRPYIPKITQLPDGHGVDRTVILELLKIGLSVETNVLSIPITICGYTTTDALAQALRLNIMYSDDTPLTDVIFELANGDMSDFSAKDMKFYSADGITEIQKPSTLNKGDLIFITIPLKTGKTEGDYSDVFRFSGNWNNQPIDYLRQVIHQVVLGVDISASAEPEVGGNVVVNGCRIGEMITVSTTPGEGYNFMGWSVNGTVVSNDLLYTFLATESINLIASFTLDITLTANPPEGGTVSGEGTYLYGDNVTAIASVNLCYRFINWTQNGIEVTSDEIFNFSATPRNLVANFEKIICALNVQASNIDYGSVIGSGTFESCDVVSVEAFVNDCYRFAGWTTTDGKTVSTDNPYVFTIMEDVELVANFYALDFDTYAPTLWDNTFMLNLKLLREEGYDVTGCIWVKNGNQEAETLTINEFSYSAGPNTTDKLEPAPTYYMFHLLTGNYGMLCSSKKTLNYTPQNDATSLIAYPNPLPLGSYLTIQGAQKDSRIYVYNQAGVIISSTVASDSTVNVKLPSVDGVYLIRNGDKTIKVVVSN